MYTGEAVMRMSARASSAWRNGMTRAPGTSASGLTPLYLLVIPIDLKVYHMLVGRDLPDLLGRMLY